MNILQECNAALNSRNVQAFLRLIRAGESSQDGSAYRMIVGGEFFDTYDDHPRKLVRIDSLNLSSTAAGAYQFLSRTWDECAKALSLPDFSPSMQDIAAVYLIRRRGALQDVLEGRIEAAIGKCAKEWASLPGSPYGQPTRSMEQALTTYAQYGGSLYTSAEPVEKPRESEHIPAGEAGAPEQTMGFFTIPAIVELAKLIPKLGSMFATSEQAQRNVKAAEVVLSAVIPAVQAANEQEAIEKIKADPTLKETATKAVEGVWFQITEAGGGGIDGARKANAAYMVPGAPGFWLNPSFWISLILISMPMLLLVDVLFVHPDSYVGELRTQIVTGVLMVIGMVGGYWIGTSISSARKDERSPA